MDCLFRWLQIGEGGQRKNELGVLVKKPQAIYPGNNSFKLKFFLELSRVERL